MAYCSFPPDRWQFWIDRGGTFTDIVAKRPDGRLVVHKLLSENPTRYADAPLQGIRELMGIDADEPIPAETIAVIKMGTTVATNALLERNGDRTLLLITAGFRDALHIGYQNRPDIFALQIQLPELLYERVIEVQERFSAQGEELKPLQEKACLIEALQEAYDAGIRSCAIVLLHGYRYPQHEQEVAELAQQVGFTQISVSHQVSPLIKLVSRGDTTTVDAYLSPILRRYVDRIATALSIPESSGSRNQISVHQKQKSTYQEQASTPSAISSTPSAISSTPSARPSIPSAKPAIPSSRPSTPSSKRFPPSTKDPQPQEVDLSPQESSSVAQEKNIFSSREDILSKSQNDITAQQDSKLQGYDSSLSSAQPRLMFMQSNGGLTDSSFFQGKDSVLSGPAGGIVGAVQTSLQAGFDKIITFDMGGTSTDVAHYRGAYERVFETEVAGVRLRSPMLAIHTVAAGGGSTLHFDGSRYRVGPDSAGAYPGPACYRNGGPLTVTDCNVMVGKIQPDYFPKVFGGEGNLPIDTSLVQQKFAKLAQDIQLATGDTRSPEQVAEGFLSIAIENMASAIKKISIQQGHDVSDYVLCCFGAAGGQHACRIAETLGIQKIFVHPYAGVLSAYGMGLADRRILREKSLEIGLKPEQLPHLEAQLNKLAELALKELEQQGIEDIQEIFTYRRLHLRYDGTDSNLSVEFNDIPRMTAQFEQSHLQRYGFITPHKDLVVSIAGVEVVGKTWAENKASDAINPIRTRSNAPNTSSPSGQTLLNVQTSVQMFSADTWHDTPVVTRDCLSIEQVISGPAIIIESTGTNIVEPGWQASVTQQGNLILAKVLNAASQHADSGSEQANSPSEYITSPSSVLQSQAPRPNSPDPVLLEIFNNLFMAIAEQMGFTLQNTSHSVNIKERLDFSCAIFDHQGQLVANAPHIPVHLGSMGESVAALIAEHGDTLQPGDVYISNNPYNGGTHLPDITAITPVFPHTSNLSTSSSHSSTSSSDLSTSSPDLSRSSSDLSTSSSDLSTSSPDLSTSSPDLSRSSANLSTFFSDLSTSSPDLSRSSANLSVSSSDLSSSSSDLPTSSSDLSTSSLDSSSSSSDLSSSSSDLSTSSSNLSTSSLDLSRSSSDLSRSSANLSAPPSDLSRSSANLSTFFSDLSTSSPDLSRSSANLSVSSSDLSRSFSDLPTSFSDLSTSSSDSSRSSSDSSRSSSDSSRSSANLSTFFSDLSTSSPDLSRSSANLSVSSSDLSSSSSDLPTSSSDLSTSSLDSSSSSSDLSRSSSDLPTSSSDLSTSSSDLSTSSSDLSRSSSDLPTSSSDLSRSSANLSAPPSDLSSSSSDLPTSSSDLSTSSSDLSTSSSDLSTSSSDSSRSSSDSSRSSSDSSRSSLDSSRSSLDSSRSSSDLSSSSSDLSTSSSNLSPHLSDSPISSMSTPLFYVASRGHHADIGGITPGSMPSHSTCLEQEGILFNTVKLVTQEVFQEHALREWLTQAPYPARNPEQNIADLQAQIAANTKGVQELQRMVHQYGLATVQAYMQHVQDNAEESVRQVIANLAARLSPKVSRSHPSTPRGKQDGPLLRSSPNQNKDVDSSSPDQEGAKGIAQPVTSSFVCRLDNQAQIHVTIGLDPHNCTARLDFTGTSPQQPNNFNAPIAVCKAVVLYVFRTLIRDNIPLNAGCLKPIELIIPPGCFLNPHYPAAVVAGNVETSQAIADALYGALGVLAASQGTMNNLTFGNEAYQYYETICGGAGAGDGFDGADAVHTHMTNSRLTDPEVLELRFPILVQNFGIRPDSGGAGQYRGGNGVDRRLYFCQPMSASILSNRRHILPFGLQGGQPGSPGHNRVERVDGTIEQLGSTTSVNLEPGDVLVIQTPGGGGYGKCETFTQMG